MLMAAKILQPPSMAASHVFPSLSTGIGANTTQQQWRNFNNFSILKPNHTIHVSNPKASTSHLHSDLKLDELKAQLHQALQGINRGIFGAPSAKKGEIEDLVKLLESQNPTPEPTLQLAKVAGNWKLVYSTITVLGAKRTKLGLRDFISLGDFWQIIDINERKAVNVIKFSARGFMLSGQLQIVASFTVATKSRVDISYNSSTITPDQLMNVFQKNYGLLLSIFNPEGWLEITYVDDTLRIGRDDKGNIFIFERSQDTP